MERKTVHALLLSLAVVAGGVMMTTDAHAQTNTERLMTTVDNTNSILAALQSLADAVADGFASVLAAIGMVQTSVDDMSGHLEHLEGDVAGISSDVASVDSSVAAVSSDVASIADDVADVSSSLQSVQNDLAGLSAGLAGSTAAFSSISEQVSANQVAINDLSAKLDMISEAVGAVQTTVETQEDVDPTVTNVLHSGSTELAVVVADFAGSLTRAPNDGEYEASNVFSCTGDVFLDTAMVDDASGVLTETIDANGLPMSMVTVEGFSLLETYDSTAAGGTFAATNVRDIGETRDFDNRFLSAGSTLVIKGMTDQSDGEGTKPTALNEGTAGANNWIRYVLNINEAGTAGNVTYFDLDEYANLASRGAINMTNSGSENIQASKTQISSAELYTIVVKWFAPNSDTECSISSALGAPSGLTNLDTELIGLNLADSEAPKPSAFTTETVDCGGEAVEITGIELRSGGILPEFITLNLAAGGDDANVRFNSDGSLDEDGSELPFEFSGDNLMVGGSGLNSLLIELSYATVKGNACDAN